MRRALPFLLALLALSPPTRALVPGSPYAPLYARYLPSYVAVPLALPSPTRAVVELGAPWPVPAPTAHLLLIRPLAAGIKVVQITIPAPPKPPVRTLAPAQDRALQARNGAQTIAWLRAHQYMRTWKNNRSPLLDQWAREAGVALASEWCGLTQMQAQKAAQLPWPSGPAGSYNWFLPGPRLAYQVGKKGSLDSLKVGYKTGLYNAGKGRIAHIMAIAQIVKADQPGRPPRGFYTLAGNEGSGTKEGVHLTYYPSVNIHASANYNY